MSQKNPSNRKELYQELNIYKSSKKLLLSHGKGSQGE